MKISLGIGLRSLNHQPHGPIAALILGHWHLVMGVVRNAKRVRQCLDKPPKPSKLAKGLNPKPIANLHLKTRPVPARTLGVELEVLHSPSEQFPHEPWSKFLIRG